MGAQRFSLAAVPLTPCKTWLLASQGVWATPSTLRCATRLTPFRGFGSAKTRTAHPPLRVPWWGPSPFHVVELRQAGVEGAREWMRIRSATRAASKREDRDARIQQNQTPQQAHQHQPKKRSSHLRTTKIGSHQAPSRSATHQAFDVAKRNQKSSRTNASEPNPKTPRITHVSKAQQTVAHQHRLDSHT